MTRRYAGALASAVLILAAGAASAQENRLTIRQEGAGNMLTVNQAGASGSRVGGLTLGETTATGQLVLNGEPQFEADGDVANQLVPITGTTRALTATVDRNNPIPALQRGTGNIANVTVRGAEGFVGLFQDNLGGTAPNSATVSLDGNGTALIGQDGSGNTANLSVAGEGAFGAILQQGSSNIGGLTVTGSNASGTISQIGNGNNTSLAVTSAVGSSVTYVLQGSGIQNFNPLQGVDVSTNAANVSITQTALGTR